MQTGGECNATSGWMSRSSSSFVNTLQGSAASVRSSANSLFAVGVGSVPA